MPILSAAPESWHARDGATVLIRPIAETDFAMERAFVDGLSHETGYRRLLSPRRLQDTEIRRFTHIDRNREMAWVAIASVGDIETMCGVTRYVREGDEAEWAIVLADAWQGRGLGTRLLGKLIDSARSDGVGVLDDVTFSTNGPMLALARRLGFEMRRQAGDATLTRMRLDLRV